MLRERFAVPATSRLLPTTRPGSSSAPGRFSEIHAAARGVLTAAGYRDIPTGSGLVRRVLSGWGGRINCGNLRQYNDRALRPGMVSAEPWAVIGGVEPPPGTTLLARATATSS